MKNIAILVKELTTSYNISVLEGIESFLNGKNDVRYTISSLGQPSKGDNGYDYQYWTSLDVLKSAAFDAAIVITNSFLSTMKLEDLNEELAVFAGKPVFSVATKLDLENSFYTHTICDNAYDEVVRHLAEKHGRKRFAFFSAGLIDSPDSEDRLRAFKAALEKNGIAFDPALVYEGDFSPGTAHMVTAKLFKKKEDVPFDALLCANDFTAGGALLALKDAGVSVPEDVAIVGFDDDSFATLTKPTLSSINQSISGSGAKAAEMAWMYLNGAKVDRMAIIQSKPVYRQSCGCIPSDTDTTAFVDSQGRYHNEAENITGQINRLLHEKHDQTMAISRLVDIMNTRIPFNEFLKKSLIMTMDAANITDLTLCVFEEPMHCGKYHDFCLPDTMKLVLRADTTTGVHYSGLEEGVIKFNPRTEHVPEHFEELPSGKFYLQPVTMNETHFGYLWCRISGTDNTVVSINMKLLTDVFILAVEHQHDMDLKKELMLKNRTLDLQSRTDELTQILNRRGFFDSGQQLINLSVSTGKKGAVFFCDLDNLKGINDTYGHETGDLAIKTEARVLKALFRESDMVGRLSGDEFGVVAPGFKLKYMPTLRRRLLELNEKFSRNAGLPFTLSISIGPIEFDHTSTDLQDLLSKADENLYIEKNEKHGVRK